MRKIMYLLRLTVFLTASMASAAGILRWDNGELIRGTGGITLGPGLELDNWDEDRRNLRFATFSGELTNLRFRNSWLDNAQFINANLTGSGFIGNSFDNANFSGTNLTNVAFHESSLENADLTGAVVMGTEFTKVAGLTPAQPYSTASYQTKNLSRIGFDSYSEGDEYDLTGWDFREQNLTRASFVRANLTNAALAGANLTRASLVEATLTNADFSGANLTAAGLRSDSLASANLTGAIVERASLGNRLTAAQLYSTESYRTKNLTGIYLRTNDLTGWNLQEQDLTDAYLGGVLTDTNLTAAIVSGARFGRSLIPEQLYSTRSYQEKNLNGIHLEGRALMAWDFREQDLSEAHLDLPLANADLTGARVTDVTFEQALTAQQLYSTQSYQEKNLSGIGFCCRLIGWDFQGQDLTNAHLRSLTDANLSGANVTGTAFDRSLTSAQLYSTQSYQEKKLVGIDLTSNDLADWDFQGQDLTGADFSFATLTDMNLTGAKVTGAGFGSVTIRGFTIDQLYSTASYQAKNLGGIDLSSNDFPEADFHDQDLSGADFDSTRLNRANLSGAKLTAANLSLANLTNTDLTGADLTNANLSYATLWRANLADANLNNVDLQESSLTMTKFTAGTVYNQWTLFPDGVDPMARGLTFVPTPLGDIDANGVFNINDLELLEARSRGTLYERWFQDGMFDIDEDGLISTNDLHTWIVDTKQTFFGDADLDGKVDFADFLTLSEHFGQPGSWRNGDFDTDGFVQFADFLILSQNFGKTGNATVPVPEPVSTTPYVGVLFLSLAMRRARRSTTLIS